MLVSSVVHCIAVLIFQLWGVQTLSPVPTCPTSCVCEKTSLVNCTSLGLSKAPSHIPATATVLDLSHNALHSLAPLGSGHMHLRGLQHLWVGNNSLESLSMCSGIQGIVGTRTLTRRKQRCVSWAPDLQSLSADRNQLKCLPRGLGNIKSLKVLQLSHNRISEIGPADLAGCTHLGELHLQHNLINTIHPEAFKDLQKLKVLDVSYNLLATIPVPAYLSLRNLNVLVDISENRWRCDCKLKTLRRWLSFDRELGNPAWEVVCFSPSHHAGKDLLYLEKSDLVCPQPVYNTPGVEKEVTVDEGMELILSCSTANQDFMHTRWWTPHGQISDSQQFLHISNTIEHDAGLYVCVSGYQEEHVSVFNVRVHKRAHDRRLRREAQFGPVELNREDNDNIQRNVPAVRVVQQSQFVLAVCLSVFITFIVAFVLGVLLRPLLEKCYKRIRNKRNSTTPPSNSRTSTNGQRPYVNEGYSDTDDQEQEVHEGPRVTFGGVTEIQEQGGVPYYVTVEDSPSGSNTDVAAIYENVKKKESLTENIEVHKEVPLREENKEMTSPRSTESLNAESNKGMQYEYIPDPEDTTEIEERSISPASSLSGEQQGPQISYEAKDSTEQSVDSPTVSIYEEDEQASTDHQATIPGFITDAFPLKMSESKEQSVDEMDPDLWNDSGDSFSFTEGSPRSSSRVSHVAALGYPPIQKEMSVDELSDRPSSCNSSESGESEGGPKEYTVNPEDDEHSETQISYSENDDINYGENRLSPFEEDILTEDQKTGTGVQFRQDTNTLDPTDIHMTYTREDSFDDEQFTEYKECSQSSNISSDYEDEPTQYHVHPVYRTSRKTTSLMVEDRSRTSSCSEENEDKQGEYPRRLEIRLEHTVPSTDATPVISPDRLLNIDYDNSSSSTDKEDKHSKEKERRIFKGLSGLSALMFNRSGSETNKKAVQPEPNTATTISKGTGGFLGFSFKKQPMMPSENVNPTTNDDNFFVTIGQAFNRLPKLKNSLLFSISPPKPPHQQESTSVIDRISESERPHVSSSFDDSIFGKIDQTLDPIPRVKRYLHFSQSPPIQAPPYSAEEEIIPNEVVKTESKKCTFSSEDDASATTKGDNFFGQIDASFDDLPKVKRYVQFSPSESQLSNHSTTSASLNQVARPEAVSKTESPSETISIFFEGQSISLPAVPKVQRYVQFKQSEPQTVYELTPTIKEDSFFGQIPISFDEVPKVKRHILFSQSESHYQTSSPYHPSKKKYPLIDEQITHEIKTSLSTGKDHAKPHNVGDNFFGQIAASLDRVPKVKKYIQFTQSEELSETLSPYFPLNKTVPIIQAGTELKRNNSPSKDCNAVVDEHNFFGQIGVFFEGIPKVRRRIQFTEHSPQPPESQPLSSLKQPGTPAVTAKGTSCSIYDAKSSQSKTNFFELIQVSLDNIPKVNRSLQFTQFEAEPSNQSIPSFFGQIDISFDEVPKVKKYLQFIKSEPQPSAQYPSTSVITESVTPESLTKMHSKRSEAEISPSIKGDNFFVQIGTSLHGLPKLKRYIQFTQSECQPSAQSPSLTVITESVTPELLTKMQSTRSEDKVSPTIMEADFFGQTGSAFDGMPKVKRYIQFTQAELYPSSQSQSPTEKMTKKKWKTLSSSINNDAKSSTKDTFLDGICASLDNIPKVKKALLFTQSEYQNSTQTEVPQNVTPRLVTKTESVRSSSLSDKEVLLKKQDNFFAQLGVSLDEVPKVKQYIQFSQAEAYPPTRSSVNIKGDQSPSPFFKTEIVTPELATKTESSSADSSFERKHRTVIKEDTFLGQTDTYFDEVPKIKRYIQFIKSEPQPSAQYPSTSVITEGVTPEFLTKMHSKRSEAEISPSIKGDNFFVQIGTSLHGLPKLKRYIQFTQSECQPSAQSPSLTVITESVTPELLTKMQSTRSEDKVSPTIMEADFFGQTGSAFDGMPKVKRYIQFTQAEPRLQPPLSHSLTNRTEKTIHASSELKMKDLASEDYNQPAAGEHNFFGPIGASTEIPKVKRYIQFSQRSTQPSSLSLHRQKAPPILTKTELGRSSSSPDDSKSNNEDTFFKKMDAPVSELPKVKRYIQFTHQHSTPPKSSNTHEVTAEVAKKRELWGSNLSMVDVKPPVTEDNFFGHLGTNLNSLPRVNRYIHFTQSELYPSSQSQSPTEKMTKKEWKTLSSSINNDAKSSTKDTFLDGICASLDNIPKVKKALLFTQSEYQNSTQTEVPQNVTPRLVTKTESVRSSSLSDKEVLLKKQDNFFGQLGVSLDEVPKVKQYIQFSQAKAYPPTLSSVNIKGDQSPSPFFKTEIVTPELATKTESSSADSSFERKHRTVIKEDTFLGQTDTYFDEVPKVKRYIQFIKSEPQPSAQYPSTSVITESVTPELLTKMQSTRSEDKVSPTIMEADFFGQTGSAFDGMPKVKRYIQFTQAEPRLQPPLSHSLTNRTEKTIHASSELKMKDLASEDYIQPAAGEHNFFGPIGASTEIPKVKRYIQFSQRSTQPSSLSLHRQKAPPILTKTELGRSSSSPDDSKSNNEDTFFKKMDAPVSELPKVKRYIQFTHQHSTPPKSSNTHEVTAEVAKKRELWGSNLSMVDVKPPVTEDNFFGHLGTNLNSLPRVNRYIHFTQSELYPSSQSQSPTEKMTKKKWKTLSSSINNDAKSSTKDTFLDGICASLDNIPKVKKALLFTQSEYQNSTQTEVPQNVTPWLVTKTESVRSSSLSDKEVLLKKQDNFFAQLGVSLDEVPKVKQYIQFSQAKAYPPTLSSVNIKGDQSPSPFFKTEIVTPELATKTESSSADSSFERKHRTVIKEDTFLGQTDTYFDEVPKVKRYIQFIKSEPQPSAQYPSTSVITESVTPELLTKMQSTRSEDKVSPTIMEADFFGQTGSAFDGMPKVKRYIQFTQAEPRLQPPLSHSLTNRTEKTIHASSELKMKDLASEDYIQPAAGEHNFFGPIGASTEIPKVKRYIQFSQRSTQPSSLSLHRQKAPPILTKTELGRSSSSPDDSKSNNEDTFFKKMDAPVSELPKVKRYIQFTHQHSTPPKSSNTHEVTAEVAKKRELWGSNLSMVDVKPSVTEDNFFGHLGTNLNSLPRVNRYIHFTQSELYPSSQSQSPTEKMTKKEWKTLSSSINNDAKSDKEVISKKQDNFFGQLGVSLDEVPKVKQYIQFSQAKAYPPTLSSVNIKGDQSPSPFFKTEIVTPELATKTESSSADSSFERKHRTVIKEDTFLGQTDTYFDEVPKVKRYIQFIKSEPQPSAQYPSTSVITESVTPVFSTKMQSTKSEDTVSPSIKGDNFFGQTGSSFNGMPKVKRYIQFTQAEPYSSSQSQSPNEKMTKKEWKTLSSSTDNEAKSSTKDTYFDGISLDNIPKVKKALQFTQSENQNITAANDKSSNAANLFGSLDLSFKQLPTVKRNVHIVQSEPYRSSLVPSKFLHRSNLESEQSFPSEDEFKLNTKENDSFGQRDGVPRLNRYIQFRQSEPQTQTLSPSLSSQKWESVDVGTESRMLNQLPKPRRSPFSSNPDAYGQPDQVFMQVEEVFRQTSSNPSSDNKKYANTQGSSSRTALSTTESETILESYLRASSNERQTRKHLVMDPALQDASQSITETPAASSEKDDAREYLRDSSLARQRQERRRLLFQQKRRAMDGFSLTSESFTSQETNQ